MYSSFPSLFSKFYGKLKALLLWHQHFSKPTSECSSAFHQKTVKTISTIDSWSIHLTPLADRIQSLPSVHSRSTNAYRLNYII